MYLDRDFPQPAIDADSFSSALLAGALDECLDYSRREENGDGSDAALNCRLAEALFHRDRREEALECGLRVFVTAAHDPHALYFCAWLFSNCGCHREAANAYRRLVELYPDWAEGYRHASGSLAAVGAIREATDYAVEACARAPHNLEFALHAGALLVDAGRCDEAIDHLRRAVSIAPYESRVLLELSAACYAGGRQDEAVSLAVEAAALAPDDNSAAMHAAELLLRSDRAAGAAEILYAAARHGPDDPALLRVLSGIEMVQGHLDAALSAIDTALVLAPDIAEYHLHRGHILSRLGDLGAAAAAFDDAAGLEPTSPDLKRAQIDLYLAQGRAREATALAGELLNACPDDPAAAETVLHLLGERLQTVEGDYIVLHDGNERPARPLRPLPGFLDRLRSQRRVIRALIIRETRTRFGESKLGYGWALLEPVLHIALLSVAFSVLMHGQPPIGSHFFLFYFTGLIPYLVFVHTSSSMAHAITSNGALLQLPLVTTFDVIAARGLLEVITDVIVAVVVLIGFAFAGLTAMPDDLWAPFIALLVTALLGCGIGYGNAVLTVFWRGWDKIYAQVTRALYFISGIFYVPGMMPDWARDAVVWNPLLHAIDWFRSGFFAEYQPHWLDRSYLVMLAILALLAGISLERCLRRKLSEPL